jgi:hypothetical protein
MSNTNRPDRVDRVDPIDRTTNSSSGTLLLGDIIRILAPTNPAIHQHMYFIFYIDPESMRCFDVEDLNLTNELELEIDETGALRDKSIDEIQLMDRPDERGYAAQNGLDVGIWLDIYFSAAGPDDTPSVITGEILTRQEDMIELRTHPGKELIYIDFEYKGLPKSLPIDRIDIRDPIGRGREGRDSTADSIADSIADSTADSTGSLEEGEIRERRSGDPDDPDDPDNPTRAAQPTPQIDLFNSADRIVSGTVLGRFVHEVVVDEAYRKYDIDVQIDDLVNDLMTAVKPTEHDTVARDIQRTIARYTQLRTTFSKTDRAGNIVKGLVRGDAHRPLVKRTIALDTPSKWFVPIVRHIKRLYDDARDNDNKPGADFVKTYETLMADIAALETIESREMSVDDTRYHRAMNQIVEAATPFNSSTHRGPYITDSTIHREEVAANMDLFVDTEGDMKSPHIRFDGKKSDGFVTSTRFSTERYISKLVKSTTFETGRGVANGEYNTYVGGNVANVRGVVVLPREFQTAAGNILERVDAPRYYIDSDARLRTERIGQTTTSASTMKREIPTRFIPDNSADGVEKFLNTVVPTTRDLFAEMVAGSVAGSVAPILSVNTILDKLQPYHIEHDDIAYKTYVAINEFLVGSVKHHKAMLVQRGRDFDKLANMRVIRGTVVRTVGPNTLRGLTHSRELGDRVFSAYGLDVVTMTETEMFGRMKRIDDMRLFFAAVASTQLELMAGSAKEDIERLKRTIAAADAVVGTATPSAIGAAEPTTDPATGPTTDPATESSCATKLIAKHYTTQKGLDADNSRAIYFDPRYDTTRYETARSYKDKRSTSDPPAFRTFLVGIIMENVGLSERDAEIEADAMVLGKRVVRDGNYAILGENGDFQYFVRDEGRWTLDDTLKAAASFDQTTGLCSIDPKCISSETTCNDLPGTKSSGGVRQVADIIREYDADFDQRIESLTADVNTELQNRFDGVEMRIHKQATEFRAADRIYREIGAAALADPETGTTADPEAAADPTKTRLLETILGQSDIAKRSRDIRKFGEMFTRTYVGDESPYWQYCVTTGGKLLPSFLVQLANTFLIGGDYLMELDTICADQGTISDDGDSWVCRYSARTIRRIDFNSDAEYAADGYKLHTRDVFGTDVSDMIRSVGVTGTVAEAGNDISETATMTMRVVSAIASFVGFDPIHHMDYVVRNSESVLRRTLPTEEVYNEQMRSKKKPPAYTAARNRLVVTLSIAHLFASIQTSVPPIRTKRTFPGCVKSFSGFPFDGVGDLTGINYLSCIAAKIKSSAQPWGSMTKKDFANLSNTVETFIARFVVDTTDYSVRVAARQAYNADQSDRPENDDSDIDSTFVRLPTHSYEHTPIVPLAASFMTSMKSHMRLGEMKYDLEIIREKANMYARGVQATIQSIVAAETLLLKNSAEVPFMENACCDKKVSSKKALDYFIKKNSAVESHTTAATNLEHIISDITLLHTAPYLLDIRDTRKPISRSTQLTADYSDTIIATAILRICSKRTMRPFCKQFISKDLMDVDITPELITRALVDGTGVSRENFARIMGRVIQGNRVMPGANTMDAMDAMDAMTVDLPGDPYRIGLEEWTAAHKRGTDAVVELNHQTRTHIHEILDANRSGIIGRYKTKREYELIRQFVEETTQFSTSLSADDRKLVELRRPPITRLSQVASVICRYLMVVFPTMIQSRSEHPTTKLPFHWIDTWGVSEKHQSDLIGILNTFHTSFPELYGDKTVSTACADIESQWPIIQYILQSADMAEGEMGKRLGYETAILMTLRAYTSVATNPQFIVRKPLVRTTGLGVSPHDPGTATVEANMAADHAVEGTVEQDGSDVTRLKIINLLLTVLTPMTREYTYSGMKYEDIQTRMRTTRDKEKDGITTYLKNIGEEHRQVEDQMKDLKLGRWNVGMQKGLTRYVGETYDRETNETGMGDLIDVAGDAGDGDDGDGIDEFDMADIPDDDDDISEL